MNIKEHTPKRISLMEAARLIGINKNRACRWVKRGLIKTTYLPEVRRHLVTQEEIRRVKELLSDKQNNS